jgi:hypothetical protein
VNCELVPRLERKHVRGQSQSRVRGRSGTVLEECRPRGGVAKRGRGRGSAGTHREEMGSTLFASGRCCAESGQERHCSRRSCLPSITGKTSLPLDHRRLVHNHRKQPVQDSQQDEPSTPDLPLMVFHLRTSRMRFSTFGTRSAFRAGKRCTLCSRRMGARCSGWSEV